MLDVFGNGWKHKFQDNLLEIVQLFPDITVEYITNFEGMLRIKLTSLDKTIQYMLDCVTYKIERDSAITCETCGKRGRRTQPDDAFFKQRKCLCWTCYAIEIDSMESHNVNKSSTQ